MERLDIQLPDNAPTKLFAKKHVEYIVGWNKAKGDFEYVMSEYLRMSGLYWCLTALDILGQPNAISREDVLQFVEQCHHPGKGFSCAPDNDPHLLHTLSAIQILTLHDAVQPEYAESAVTYIKSLQREDGSFVGDDFGEVDTRFSFCALACLALLDRLEEVDVDKAVEFVLRCRNFDGAFGRVPGSESHAGQVFCCVGALAITDSLHRIDRDQLGWWLCERQLPSGGFNGRPEKLPDVCYSWWILSSMCMIDRLDWIDAHRLRTFILACQDDETGGFADRPGDMVDPFHTLFGNAALSLLGEAELGAIHPVFCMPRSSIERSVRLSCARLGASSH